MAADADRHNFGGVWTLIKLDVLERYLSAFTLALSNQNFRRVYIDAFAGTGRCDVILDGNSEAVDGSARRALNAKPSFDHCCLIEQSSTKTSALNALASEFSGRSIEIIQGEANVTLRELCRRTLWKNSRAVLFLDPYGLQVEWETLQTIAQTRAIDVWYLFPYAGLYRQAARDVEKIDLNKEAAITRMLGTDEWRKTFYKPRKQMSLFGAESDVREASHQEMLEYVSDRLRTIFPAVSKPKILSQSTGAPLFALYFAVSNPSHRAIGVAMNIANHIIGKA